MMAVSMVSRVKRGADLLDEQLPDWYKRIDTAELQMERYDRCILGQTFKDWLSPEGGGSYLRGLRALGIQEGSGHRYGFDLDHAHDEDDSSYGTLARYWSRAIGRRLIRDGKRLTG